MDDHQACRILKQRIETSHINVAHFTAAVFAHILGQEERSRITLLTGNKFRDLLHFRRIDKGTLNTYRISTLQEEHISLTNQTVCPRTVKNRTGVHHSGYTERNTCREVRLDRTCNDIRCRTLRSDDHMNTDRTCQLRNTGNRKFHFLTGSHDQISELIDHHHDIRHKLMSFLRIEAAVDKLLIILLDITYMSHLQEVIACIHFHTNRIQRLHYLGHVRNNRFASIRKFGQKMVFNDGINAELHLLRVDQHKFQFSRMLLI